MTTRPAFAPWGRFLAQNARWLSAGALLTLLSSFGQTFFISLFAAEVQAEFALSHGDWGMINALGTMASAAVMLWAGGLTDRWRARSRGVLVRGLLAVSCLAMAVNPFALMLPVIIFALRLTGQGMTSHIAVVAMSRWFVATRGRATSLIVPGHQAGEAFLPISFTAIAVWIGWQVGWVVAAGLLLVFALPLVLRLWRGEREPHSTDPEINSERLGPDKTVAQVAADPIFYALLVGVLASPFIGTTIFFHQDYLIELRGYNALAFAAAFPIMAVTTVAFSLVSGQLIDRFGAIRLLPFFLTPLASACLAVGLLEQLWGIYAFMFLVGVSYGFTAPLVGALWPEVYGVRNLGSVRAIVVAVSVAATAIGPGLTGYLIDNGVSLPVQMIYMSGWCLAACFILAAITPIILKRNRAHAPAA